MKTKLTRDIECKLYYATHADERGTYGCYEVCVGNGCGQEFIDFATMDSKEIFRCYEIKASTSDFYSKSRKTFIGNFNYFVMPYKVYEDLLKDDRSAGKQHIRFYLNNGIGLLVYNKDTDSIKCIKKAKRKEISMADKALLMHSMIRSISRYAKSVLHTLFEC